MDGFTRLERAVLEALLAGEHSVLVALRQQLERATMMGRKLTGVGFFAKIKVPDDMSPPSTPPRVHLGDVIATIPGLEQPAGFLLFVNNGMLHTLEGYTFDEPWPTHTESFFLTYTKVPRDLSMLSPAEGSS